MSCQADIPKQNKTKQKGRQQKQIVNSTCRDFSVYQSRPKRQQAKKLGVRPTHETTKQQNKSSSRSTLGCSRRREKWRQSLAGARELIEVCKENQRRWRAELLSARACLDE